MVQKLLYLALLLLGTALGWSFAARDLTVLKLGRGDAAAPSSSASLKHSRKRGSPSDPSAKSAERDRDYQQADEVVTPTRMWTASELIDYLNALDPQGFAQAERDKEFKNLAEAPPELIIELLQQYLDLPDQLQQRLLQTLLNNSGWLRNFQTSEPTQFSIERWIVDNVKNENRADDWFQFLGQVGVHRKENVNYMLTQAESAADPLRALNAIRAVANSFLGHLDHLTEAEKKTISDRLRPFINTDNATLRAAALQSLQSFPSADAEQQVLAAINDPQAEVSIAGINVSASKQYKSKEFERAIMTKMLDKSSSDLTRITAHAILNWNFVLDEENYQIVYNFARDELPVIRTRWEQQQRKPSAAQ